MDPITGKWHHWCVGSGVAGDVWEHGHDVLPGTEEQMFPRVMDGHERYSANTYSRKRCIRCQSTRYYTRRESCWAKAGATRRDHARKLVKRGFAVDYEHGLRLLDVNGCTQQFIADQLRDAYGKTCPGLCCRDHLDENGEVIIEPHVITEYADLQWDWRDPRFPLTAENSGPLCATCNQQKHEMAWPEFMARQRAIIANLRSSSRALALF